MKRFSLGFAVAGLTASIGAYAALPTGAEPFQVNIPKLKPGLEFNVTGLYLRPTQNNLDYATVLTVGNTNNVSVNPEYNLGFGLGIGYVFPNSGNDVRLNWTHFSSKDTNSVSTQIAAGAPIIYVPYNFAYLANITNASGSTKFKYDAIDLVGGHFVNFGARLQVRIFGGLRYASLENDFTQFYANQIGVVGGYGITFGNVSKFNGIGPLFGVDMAYHLGNHFGIVGQVAGSLLIGSVKSNINFIQNLTLNNNTTTSTFTITSNNVNRVVPGVDAKLGVDYSYPLCIGSVFSVFTAELGYQGTYYVNAFDQLQLGLGAVNRIVDSIGFNGPYLSLNLKV